MTNNTIRQFEDSDTDSAGHCIDQLNVEEKVDQTRHSTPFLSLIDPYNNSKSMHIPSREKMRNSHIPIVLLSNLKQVIYFCVMAGVDDMHCCC